MFASRRWTYESMEKKGENHLIIVLGYKIGTGMGYNGVG